MDKTHTRWLYNEVKAKNITNMWPFDPETVDDVYKAIEMSS